MDMYFWIFYGVVAGLVILPVRNFLIQIVCYTNPPDPFDKTMGLISSVLICLMWPLWVTFAVIVLTVHRFYAGKWSNPLRDEDDRWILLKRSG